MAEQDRKNNYFIKYFYKIKMNEIVIAIIVTLVLLGLGIGLYFALKHNTQKDNSSINWTDGQKSELNSFMKNFLSMLSIQSQDVQFNCILDKITSNINYNDFKEIKNNETYSNNGVKNILFIGKSISNCIPSFNWDTVSSEQLQQLIPSANIDCVLEKIKIKYNLGEFLIGVTILKAYKDSKSVIPPILNEFSNNIKSILNSCKSDN